MNKENQCRYLTFFFFALAILFSIISVKQHTNLTLSGKVFCTLLIGAFTYGGCFSLAYVFPDKKNQIRKGFVVLSFIIYFGLLVNTMIFNSAFGRQFQIIFRVSSEYRAVYIEHCVNLIPGKTILSYLSFKVNNSYMVINLFGNLVALTPCAILFPNLFCSLRKTGFYSIAIIVISFAIEGLQLLFMCGSADVDDVILNSLGSIVCFYIIYHSSVKRIIDKILWREIV